MALLSSLKLVGLAYTFLGISVLAQNLGKTSLWGAGISPLIDESLWQNLVPNPSAVQQWPAGSIPQRCSTLRILKCSESDVQIVEPRGDLGRSVE